MKESKITVWVTKYALTTGIFEAEASICSNDDQMIIVYGEDGRHDYFHRPFWHETKNGAIEHANLLKDRKIKNLKKQIVKFESLKFD